MKENFMFKVLHGISKSVHQATGFCTKVPQIKAKRMEGKMMLIADTAIGIGEVTTRMFAVHRAHVVVADVQEEAGTQMVAELGNNTEFICCDVQSEDDVVAAVGVNNVLDMFHYNTGILDAMGPINQLHTKEFDHTMSINLCGVVLGMKQATRVMKPANKGSIIFTGSVSSVQGGIGPHMYTISKSAIG